MEDKHWVLLAVVLAGLAYAAYELASASRRNADLTAPPRQPAPDDADAQARMGFMVAPDGHSRLCQPAEHHAGYTYTPHRYPRTVGGEVTAAIHHGFSSMRVPNVDDVQWIISPPSEAAW